MKRALPVILAVLLAVSGCSGGRQEQQGFAGDITIASEKIVKEFSGTVNIYNRIGDTLMLTAENGDSFENYDVDIKTGQVAAAASNSADEQYVYFEQVADRGDLYVVGEGTQNVLKFKDKGGNEKVIASNVGFADGINISISPKGSKIAYTALKEGSDEYSLFMHDLDSSKNYTLADKVDEGFITSFGYLVNWSADDKYVIIQDKYIYDTVSGTKKGELAASYTKWSPSCGKIAFILEEDPGKWLNANDSTVYPGKKLCIYDMKTGDYRDLFTIHEDEFVFGDVSWSRDEKSLAFAGIKIKDMTSPEWYTMLVYNSVYIVDTESGKANRIETKVDASDGSMTELSNLMFTGSGNLLSYTVGNFEKSNLYVYNIKTGAAKSFDNVGYLHWIDNQSYVIPAGDNGFYFCLGSSIIKLDEELKQTTKYTSKSSLDDFYLSGDGTSIIVLESEGSGSIIRYLGK